MPGQARAGDRSVGICPLHKQPRGVTGKVLPAQGIVFTDGKANAIMGNKVIHSCGHVGTIISASSIQSSSGKADGRQGDKVAGGPITTIMSQQSSTNTD